MDIKSLKEKVKSCPLMNNKQGNNLTFWLGLTLVGLGALIIGGIFYPVAREEIKYSLSSLKSNKEVITKNELREKQNKNSKIETITPINEDFGIVIPKIGANARVIPEVDAQNSDVYQRALTKGVAHAKGTALPSEDGNVFIFAHSGANLFEANRYNAVFYLLSKLEMEDNIYIFYQGKKYFYRVTEIRTVSASEVSYLESNSSEKKLTLMTCWPPGTTLKRLVIIAKLSQ